MESASGSPRHWAGRVVREFVQTVLPALVLYAVISFFFGRYTVLSVSMEPNFHEGQRIVVARLGSRVSPLLETAVHADEHDIDAAFGPERGQVVVLCREPECRETPLVKRVIGLPGDRVEIAQGAVWINGERQTEPYVRGLPTECRSGCRPLVLESGMYYVLGDNRTNSLDSRYFGAVRRSQILGRVLLRYWPLDKIEVYR